MADLPTQFHLTVVTRERKIIETDAVELVLPAYDGEVGILTGHAPMLALLGKGVLRLGRDGGQKFNVEGGFLQVVDNVVRVVTERASTA